YPPAELVFAPPLRDRFDSPDNQFVIRYLIARQAAYWNLAYWSLGNTEVYEYGVKDEQEFLDYGRYLAGITPYGRMITAQDCEQRHGADRRWLSKLDLPAERKLNTVQTAPGNPNDKSWQQAAPNNALALDAWGNPPEYGGFPVLATEGLWEGQGRAEKPLRIIWGFFTAGAHTVWADWRYENDNHTFGSIGRCWVPLPGLDVHLFTADRLGADCSGDEQLVLAAGHLREYEYWKMAPHNELAAGGAEAYCLAEPGRQYLVYTPDGGSVNINLGGLAASLTARWFDPRDGTYAPAGTVQGGGVQSFTAPDGRDWVLSIKAAGN
ncbi:MAG TPA: putative collagen-binding domain-containing protein, partial [Candidatus Glassbacteria bacterium]|nr:putative collagen-binding domain-containing protein [Candidatus Glassbacteria bacterium]